jgi:hypothetical protein
MSPFDTGAPDFRQSRDAAILQTVASGALRPTPPPYYPHPADFRPAGLTNIVQGPGLFAFDKYVALLNGTEATATKQLVAWNDGTFHAARRQDPKLPWDWGNLETEYPSLEWLLNWFEEYD